MGKFDVWYCTISSGGTLSAANNMGNTINTKEEESASVQTGNPSAAWRSLR
jgi:hypothetical protein